MKADAKPTLDDAAKLIAKGPPPDWLVGGLDHFSGFVGGDAASSIEKKETKQQKLLQMHDRLRLAITANPLVMTLLFAH